MAKEIKVQLNSSSLLLRLFIAILVCIGIVITFYYSFKPGGDYANYYFGSKFLVQGIPVDKIYDPACFNVLISEEGIKQVFVNYGPIPPFSLLFFIPFTALDFYTSKLLFNLVSVLVFSFSLYGFLKFINFENKLIPFLLLIIIIPLRNNIILGQTYLLLAAFLMQGYILSVNKKQFISSFLFAIPIVLKLFPAVILLWLFITGRIKEFWLTVIFCAFLFLSVIPFTSFHHLFSYVVLTFPRLAAGEFNDPFSITYQTCTVLLRKLFVYDGMMNPYPWFDSPILFNILNTAIIGLLLTAGISLLRKYRESNLFTFGFIFLLGLLISGYGTSYSLILLILPAIGLLLEEKLKLSLKIVYTILLILITTFPVHLFFNAPFPFQYIRLWLLLIVFIIIIIKKEPPIPLRSYGIIAALLFIPVILRYMKKQDKSSYYLKNEPSALLLNFKIDKNNLIVDYFNDNGKDSILYPICSVVNNPKELPIINNQIIYQNMPITYGSDFKKKAILVNDKEVIYLSDKGKGVGLYSLRKLMVK